MTDMIQTTAMSDGTIVPLIPASGVINKIDTKYLLMAAALILIFLMRKK